MPALPISALTQVVVIFGIENKPEALRLRAAVEIFLDAAVWKDAETDRVGGPGQRYPARRLAHTRL